MTAARLNLEWSKAYPCKPQDNIISHRYAKSKPFIPSYEKNCFPVNMNLLLGWEYARIWEREHNAYICARKESEKTRIVRRKPMKGRQMPKSERSRKRSQIASSQLAGKSSKPKKTMRHMTVSSSKNTNKTGGGELNCGYGDIVPDNLQLTESEPLGEIYTGDIECQQQTKEDLKLMKNEMAQQFPKTYLDPSQYLGGIPLDAADAEDVCQNVAVS